MSDTVIESELPEEAVAQTAAETVSEAVEAVSETVETATETVAAVAADARDAIESTQNRLIDSVTASQQEAIDTVESARSALVEGLGLAHRSFTDFLAERIRHDLATQRALLRSESLGEARAIGFAHVRATVDQYGAEMSRMVRLGSTVALRSLDRPRLAVRGA